MDPKSTTPAADTQRPQGDYLKLSDGTVKTFNLDPAKYGYIAPGMSDQELLAAAFEDHERALGNALERKAPANGVDYPEGLCTRWEGGTPEPPPAILERDDGNPVIYGQRLSIVYGEPSCGKSWVGLIAAGEAIRKGGRVHWWDFEDTLDVQVDRSGPLGARESVTDFDRFRFVHARTEFSGAAARASAWLLSAPDPRFSLVVIDSAEKSGCPSDGDSVGAWLNRFVDPWCEAGVAVLVLDHVPKRPKDRPPGPIGSQAKRAAVTGAALFARGRVWTRDASGYVSLFNEKDRPGHLHTPMGKAVATIRGDYDGSGGFAVTVTAPKVEDESEGETADLEAVYEAIKAAGLDGIKGQRKLGIAAQIGTQKAAKAAEELAAAGRIIQEETGKGNVYRVDGDGLTKEQAEDVNGLLPGFD